MTATISRKIVVDLSIDAEAFSVEQPADWLDDLLTAITNADLPNWIYSVDGIDPADDER